MLPIQTLWAGFKNCYRKLILLYTLHNTSIPITWIILNVELTKLIEVGVWLKNLLSIYADITLQSSNKVFCACENIKSVNKIFLFHSALEMINPS